MPKNPDGTGAVQSQTSSDRPMAAIASVRIHSDHAGLRLLHHARVTFDGSLTRPISRRTSSSVG